MKDKVIIDTSVWINYFQNPPSILSEQVKEIVFYGEVYVPKIIIAELIQGAHSEKEVSAIQNFLDAFRIVGEDEDTWFNAGKLSYALKKKGRTVNLTDCYIAVIAKKQNCAILTLDKHFKEIEKESGIRLIAPCP
ncbi:MAG: PIN domain-containing protein [Nitrospinae bacterium]|nr:PIN domain-containing protein [Nitrospinota bacterium]